MSTYGDSIVLGELEANLHVPIKQADFAKFDKENERADENWSDLLKNLLLSSTDFIDLG